MREYNYKQQIIMATNRRKFLSTALAGGVAATLPLSACSSKSENTPNVQYEKIDKALKRPIFQKHLFSDPVIIESIDLLRYKNNYICRVRSKDGAEGFSFGNSKMKSTYSLFLVRIKPFFIGKDARDLESLIDGVYLYEGNYKLQGVALWVPLATLEFAILDLLGQIAQKPMGLLLSDRIHNPVINVYQANSERGISAEVTLDHLREQLDKSQAKAIKVKIGGRMSHPEYPKGRSEKLIALIRKTFGENYYLFADSNGSYDAKEAVRIGKILEENNYAFYEEPVPFDWYEETKQVADGLTIPIAGGEQESSLHNFRWLLANDALQIAQADMFYFGGMIRCMKVARMAEALGKVYIPHVSNIGYVYMLHFVSAIPNAGPFHELKSPFNDDMSFECKTSALLPSDGTVIIPTDPGLGIIFDPDFIKKHEVVKG